MSGCRGEHPVLERLKTALLGFGLFDFGETGGVREGLQLGGQRTLGAEE